MTTPRLAACRLLTLAATATAIAAPTAPTRDVLGIQTGMSLAQAEALITQARPGIQKEAVRNHAGQPLGFRYTRANANDPDQPLGKTQIVLGLTHNGHIWFVGQAQNFDVGERPDYAALRRSLLDKYGEPTRPGPAEPPAKYLRLKYGMLWSFDPRLKLLSAAELNRPTAQDPCQEAFTGDNLSQTWGTNLIVPRRTAPTCGLAIAVGVSFDPETQRIAAFSVTLTDTTALYTDPLHGTESRAWVEKKRKLEQEARGGQKIEL